MVRVTDQVNIEIEEPRLAVLMTCTGSQLVLLRPGVWFETVVYSPDIFGLLGEKWQAGKSP